MNEQLFDRSVHCLVSLRDIAIIAKGLFESQEFGKARTLSGVVRFALEAVAKDFQQTLGVEFSSQEDVYAFLLQHGIVSKLGRRAAKDLQQRESRYVGQEVQQSRNSREISRQLHSLDSSELQQIGERLRRKYMPASKALGSTAAEMIEDSGEFDPKLMQ